MGNTTSQQGEEEEEQETVKSVKVPKHLQPLKRKHTKRTRNNSSSATTIVQKNNNKLLKEQQQPQENNKPIEFVNNQLSCSSSPQLFCWTKGRRYHNNDVRTTSLIPNDIIYPLPNDQSELDRHRVQFYIIRWAFESRHIVPPTIKKKLFEGIKVLDVGCGPGLWLGYPILDMAQDFTKSTFEAINVCNLLPPSQHIDIDDNNSIQEPTTKREHNTFMSYQPSSNSNSACTQKRKADNFKLTIHNIVKDGQIPFKDNTFDFVQQSLATLAYAGSDWLPILHELKRVTKSGGYIQLIEIDLHIQPLGQQGGLWRDQILNTLSEKRGIDARIACRLHELLGEIGLVEIETRFVSIPYGSWGLDIGNLWEQNIDAFLEAARPFFADMLGVSDHQYRKERKQLKEELKGVKAFNNVHVAWGRLP